MVSSLLWAEALGITDNQLNQWRAQCPVKNNDQALLRWCLDHHKLDEEAYVKWLASETGWAIIRPEFFDRLPTPIERLSDWVRRYPTLFNMHCLPVHEWDGVVFVAVDEKRELPALPERPELDFTPQMVLATPTHLQRLWLQLQPPPPSDQAPRPELVLLPQEVSAEARKEEFSFEALAAAHREVAHRGAAPTGATHPGATHPGATQPAEANQDATAEDKLKQEENHEAPVGLDLAPPVLRLKLDDFGFPSPITTPAAKLELVHEEPQANLEETVIGPEIKEEPPVATPEIKLAPAAPTHSLSREDHERCEKVFSKIINIYKQAMVLVVHGNELQALHWTTDWKASSDHKPISLVNPSIFRIAFESKLPFHGSVRSNPVNDAFFSEWNNGITPPFVTIMPVIIDQRVIALILGANASRTVAPVALNVMEKASSEFAASYSKAQQTAA